MGKFWKPITVASDIEQIVSHSDDNICLIFKHSTRCEISAIAKLRLESQWHLFADRITPYYLDLLSYREISNKFSELFQVYHESPQILLIHKGECIHDASHLDITIAEISEAMDALV